MRDTGFLLILNQVFAYLIQEECDREGGLKT